MKHANGSTVTDELMRRIHGEFAEMPGMHLTARQAQRLWGLDEDTCARVLSALVEVRFLRQHANGCFHRTTDGPAVYSPGASSPVRASIAR